MHSRRSFLEQLFAAAAPAASLAGSAEGSSPWQLGCYTRPWAAHDYRVALDAIAAAGFRHVGLMSAKNKNNLVLSVSSTPEEAAAVGQEVKQRGLKTVSLWGGQFPLQGPDGLKRLIDNAAACGSPQLMIGGTDEKNHDAYYRIVAECCPYAESRGVGMSVKPHGGANASGAQCRRIVQQVGHRNFRIWYDPGNIFYYSDGRLDPVQDVPSVKKLVVGMSVKDFRLPKVVDLTPGTGLVHFAKVMAGLKKGGFRRGPLVVECLAPGELAQLQAEAVKARQFLEKLTGQKA